jgi:hypothetical protein
MCCEYCQRPGQIENDGGGVDPKKFSTRGRRDRRRPVRSGRDRLGALADPEIVARLKNRPLFKKQKKTYKSLFYFILKLIFI